MEQGKIGFFRRMFLAITDFRYYPYVVREKTYKAIAYYFKIVLFCSALIAIYSMTVISDFLNDGIEEFDKKVPNFYTANNELVFSGDYKWDVNSNLTFVMNDGYAKDFKYETLTSDRIYIVASKDKIEIGNPEAEEPISQVNISEIGATSKQQIVNDIKSINTSITSKILLYLIVFASVFIYMLINRFWSLLLYITLIFLCNLLFIVKLRFKDYFKLAIYISTLPILLETFAICVGGKYSTSAEIITFLIANVYAFYALRAIRIDDVILKTAGKTTEEKIINAIRNAQEQLENQIKDMDKKEEEKRNELNASEETKENYDNETSKDENHKE